MPMNLVIQEKRKELGLTQEQIAEYLNVSIPAVCKWEKGSTSPDIALLPPLARLLKIDLNTLFCFQEDISPQEIRLFCDEITGIVQAEGIEAGFETARRKIHEYPHNETLLHYLTFQLDGLLIMSGLPSGEMRPYDNLLTEWYARLAESDDNKISNSAKYMMVSRCIRQEDFEKAQEILDSMPDREDILGSMADKLMLQVILYQHQGQAEKAAGELQNAVLIAINKVQMLLHKLVDAELASGEIQTAKYIADKAAKMTDFFDLWEYNSFIAPLQVAGAEEDAGECIRLLRRLLDSLLTPWDMGGSPLFSRIAKPSKPSRPKQLLPAILTELERSPSYDFLRNSKEFKELLSKYRALTGKEKAF